MSNDDSPLPAFEDTQPVTEALPAFEDTQPVATAPRGGFNLRQRAYRQAIHAGAPEELPGAEAPVAPQPELRHTGAELAEKWEQAGKGLGKGALASTAGLGFAGDIEGMGRHVVNKMAEHDLLSEKPEDQLLPPTTQGGFLGPRGADIMAPAANEDEALGMNIASGVAPGAAFKLGKMAAGSLARRFPALPPEPPTTPPAPPPAPPGFQTVKTMTGKPPVEPIEMPSVEDAHPVATPRDTGARLLAPDISHTPDVTSPEYAQQALASRRGAGAAGISPLADTSPETIRAMWKVLDEEGFTPATLEQRLEEMSPHQFLSEIGDATTHYARGVTASGGLGRTEIMNSFRGRAGEAQARMNATFDQTFGPESNTFNVARQLTADQKAAANPAYRAFRETQIPPTQELVDLTPRLQRAGAFAKARQLAGIQGRPWRTEQFFNGEAGQYPTAQSWDLVKRALDSKIEKAFSSGDKTMGSALRDLRTELLKAIDEHPDPNVRGVWRNARNIYAGPARVKEALQNGRELLTPKVDPDEFTFRMNERDFTPAELSAMRTGVRAHLRQILGRPGNQNLRAINEILAPNNMQKLTALLGEEEAQSLERAIRYEFEMHHSPRNLQNSLTAEKQAGQEFWAAKPSPLQQAVETGIGLVHKPGRTIAARALERHNEVNTAKRVREAENVRREAARLFTMQGPERDAVAKWILENGENYGLTRRRAAGGPVEGDDDPDPDNPSGGGVAPYVPRPSEVDQLPNFPAPNQEVEGSRGPMDTSWVDQGSQTANEAAAERIRRSSGPHIARDTEHYMFGRKRPEIDPNAPPIPISEAIPQVAHTIGEGLYDMAARPSRIWNSLNSRPDQISEMDAPDEAGINPQTKEAMAGTALDIIGAPGIAAPKMVGTGLASGLVRRGAENAEAPFFSAVEKAIEKAPQEKMTPEQWAGWLKNQPGVKKEELDWLAQGDDSVLQKPIITKQEMLDHAQSQGVQLNEVEKLEKPKSFEEAVNSHQEELEESFYYDEGRHPNRHEQQALRDEAIEHVRDDPESYGITDSVRYGQYQLPGGQNYRETLLTLPREEINRGVLAKTLRQKYGENFVDHWTPEEKENYYKSSLDAPSTSYVSSHWNEPNVLMHMRMNDRDIPTNIVDPRYKEIGDRIEKGGIESISPAERELYNKLDANGGHKVDKSLHLEELQSDWHQVGRKKGYVTDNSQEIAVNKEAVQAAAKNKEEAEQNFWKAVPEKAPDFKPFVHLFQTSYQPETFARSILSKNDMDALSNEINAVRRAETDLRDMNMHLHESENANVGRVPDAPFKNSWADLGLRHAIVKAAREGYDSISWTPGIKQAERYDLSKQLDTVRAMNNGDGTYRLIGLKDNAGNQGRHDFGNAIPRDKLADYVGKDLAEKIINQNELTKDYSGVDLKVGGEGMHAFYDKILVDKANAIGKKYGAKVEWKPLEGTAKELSDNEMDELRGLEQQRTLTAADQARHKQLMARYEGEQIQIPVLRLTPKLKEQAVEHGLSLFANQGGKEGAAATGFAAFHGTNSPGYGKFNNPDPGQFMPDRGVGVHFARDPEIAGSFASKEGGVYPVHLPSEDKFYEVKQDHLPYITDKNTPKNNRNVVSDQSAIEHEIYSHAYRKDPAMFARFLERRWNLKASEAQELAENILAGKRAYFPHAPKSAKPIKGLDDYIERDGVVKAWDEGDRAKAVQMFQKEITDKGYVGLKYINTSPMETAHAKDFSSYVVFDPSKHVRSKYTGSPMASGGAVGAPAEQDIPREPTYEHDRDQPEAKQRAAGGRVLASNIDPEPTEAQKEAGNYAKDHVNVAGFNITVENAKGSTRSGVGPDGKPWTSTLPAHYGYFKRTEGSDGDHIDVYLGDHRKSQKVFIIDQVDPASKKFDEHKVGVFFGSQAQFVNTYKRAFSDGKGAQRIGNVTALSLDELKHWLKDGNTKAPFAKPPKNDGRIGRDAFLYMKGDGPNFAQCSTCFTFVDGKCAIMDIPVEKGWTCGLYVEGHYDGTKIEKRVTPQEAGLVKGQVRCENCTYGGPKCALFQKLNKTMPDKFALEETIEPQACCNAWTAKSEVAKS